MSEAICGACRVCRWRCHHDTGAVLVNERAAEERAGADAHRRRDRQDEHGRRRAGPVQVAEPQREIADSDHEDRGHDAYMNGDDPHHGGPALTEANQIREAGHHRYQADGETANEHVRARMP